MQIRQEIAALVLWFRAPLSAQHSLLAWFIPNVFAVDKRRDILVSYEGSDLALFVDANTMLIRISWAQPRAWRAFSAPRSRGSSTATMISTTPWSFSPAAYFLGLARE